jgi:phosphoenolpyruvate carboxylase
LGIEALYIVLSRYGGLPEDSKEMLVRDYIVPVLRAHRDEIARVTYLELTDEFLNCLPRLYRIPSPGNFSTAEERGRNYFGRESFFKEAEQLAESLR